MSNFASSAKISPREVFGNASPAKINPREMLKFRGWPDPRKLIPAKIYPLKVQDRIQAFLCSDTSSFSPFKRFLGDLIVENTTFSSAFFKKKNHIL